MSRIDDGFSTTISFSEDSSVLFWEKEVTPPGMDAGGANDTTTMKNTTYRTFAPKQLITMTEATLVASYDPAVYDDILNMLGVNQLITITFADGSNIAFWGWVDKFIPGAVVEGAQPTASVTIVPSNQNGSLVETAPVYAVS